MPVAALMGIVAGIGCYYAVRIKNKFGWDDALDVWGVHGMGGVIGTIMLGIFASKVINPVGTNALIYGGSSFFLIQIASVVGTFIYAFVFTYMMLKLIDTITPVKVSEEHETIGLDWAIHGENAYDHDFS